MTTKTPVKRAQARVNAVKATAVTHANQASKTVTSRMETITPVMAEQWLASNTHNRPLRTGRAEDIAAAIKRGEWRFNGDAIRWDTRGVLLDGQHRLWAVVLAELPITTMVIRGLEPEVQATMDLGTKRNLADSLRLQGEKASLDLAAIISVKWQLDNGYVRTTKKPTVSQGLQVLKEAPALREAVSVLAKLRTRFRLTAGIGVLYHEFASRDADAADVFIEKLTTGVGLEKGSPILALRTWLEYHSSQGSMAGGRSSSIVMMALFIKAWNTWHEGRHVEKLSWKAAGTMAEAFPEIR